MYHKIAKLLFWTGIVLAVVSGELVTSYVSGLLGRGILQDPFAPLIPLLASIAAGVLAIGDRK